jgi:pyrroloquinoline quinone biosynthesis protein D
METASLPADAVPRPGPHHVFRWEARQQAYLLLYPEGLIKLNDTAGEILRRCDGSRAVEALVAELQQAFDAPAEAVREGTLAFLREALDKGWIVV